MVGKLDFAVFVLTFKLFGKYNLVHYFYFVGKFIAIIDSHVLVLIIAFSQFVPSMT